MQKCALKFAINPYMGGCNSLRPFTDSILQNLVWGLLQATRFNSLTIRNLKYSKIFNLSTRFTIVIRLSV